MEQQKRLPIPAIACGVVASILVYSFLAYLIMSEGNKRPAPTVHSPLIVTVTSATGEVIAREEIYIEVDSPVTLEK